jgi:hypothetical protein
VMTSGRARPATGVRSKQEQVVRRGSPGKAQWHAPDQGREGVCCCGGRPWCRPGMVAQKCFTGHARTPWNWCDADVVVVTGGRGKVAVARGTTLTLVTLQIVKRSAAAGACTLARGGARGGDGHGMLETDAAGGAWLQKSRLQQLSLVVNNRFAGSPGRFGRAEQA